MRLDADVKWLMTVFFFIPLIGLLCLSIAPVVEAAARSKAIRMIEERRREIEVRQMAPIPRARPIPVSDADTGALQAQLAAANATVRDLHDIVAKRNEFLNTVKERDKELEIEYETIESTVERWQKSFTASAGGWAVSILLFLYNRPKRKLERLLLEAEVDYRYLELAKLKKEVGE
jgi:hypothetical protein